jgi:hypothetical protein
MVSISNAAAAFASVRRAASRRVTRPVCSASCAGLGLPPPPDAPPSPPGRSAFLRAAALDADGDAAAPSSCEVTVASASPFCGAAQ